MNYYSYSIDHIVKILHPKPKLFYQKH